MSTPAVTATFCSPGQVEAETLVALHDTFVYDREHDQLLDPALLPITGGPRLHVLRTAACRAFLAEHSAEWLWSIDADMTWPPEAIYQLLEAADPGTAPIVGGLCFGTGRSGGALFPTIFDNVGEGFGLRARFDYPVDQLVQCDATGWAFLLVHRSVLEAIAAPTAFGKNPDGTPAMLPWFVDGQVGNELIEGDLAFCARARALEIPVHVHTGVKTGHKKVQFLTEDFYRQVQAAQEAGGDQP